MKKLTKKHPDIKSNWEGTFHKPTQYFLGEANTQLYWLFHGTVWRLLGGESPIVIYGFGIYKFEKLP